MSPNNRKTSFSAEDDSKISLQRSVQEPAIKLGVVDATLLDQQQLMPLLEEPTSYSVSADTATHCRR
jgi:hypothetical protein